jgi:hypothetical protein
MRSSQTISLFSDRPEQHQQPSTFLVSILVHAGAIALLTYGVMHAPPVKDRSLADLYIVRHLTLEDPDMRRHQPAPSAIHAPSPLPAPPTPKPDEKPAAQAPLLQQAIKAIRASQTLVQPNLPPHPELTQPVPVPNVVLWTPPKVQVKTIVPPKPEKPTAAEVKLSLDAPNKEVLLADVRVSSSEMPTQKLTILPSTTSPLTVHGPDLPQKAPTTSSNSSGDPTPTAILSLSGTRMTSGTAYLPPVNTTAFTVSPGSALGDPAGKGAGGAGTGQGAGYSGGGKMIGPGKGSGDGSGSGDQFTTTHITLSKEGQFGAVVVGNSLGEKYPEASAIMAGRLVYTVYLHLGSSKSWILQYSLPYTAAAAGNTTSLQAPWPYNIVRPNIPADAVDAEVLMIHGFVNKDGRFEGLTVAFPPSFEQAKFVVDALKQWQFRPGTQNGQNTTVEVLLIAPVDTE